MLASVPVGQRPAVPSVPQQAGEQIDVSTAPATADLAPRRDGTLDCVKRFQVDDRGKVVRDWRTGPVPAPLVRRQFRRRFQIVGLVR